MNRRILLIAAVFTIALLGLVLLWCTGPRDRNVAPVAPGEALEVLPIEEGDLPLVGLYFPGSGSRLHSEERGIERMATPEDRISALVTELLHGPQTDGLFRVFPEGVELAEVHIVSGTTALIDLASPEGSSPPASGSKQ